VRGVVHDVSGRAVSGARVVLVGPRGRRLRNRRARHATVTTVAGSFSMRAVRPRAYRVVASKHGASKGHVNTRGVAGTTRDLAIKLGAGHPPKRSKHR